MTSRRLLMVEDSHDDELLILAALRVGGHALESRRVEDAPGLVEALRSEHWDIVTSDWSLPRFSALAALPIVRAHLPVVPVVVVSGSVDEASTAAALAAGANEVVPKSHLARLAGVIERLLLEAAGR